MYMEVLRSIDGVSIFPVVSLLVFATFFTVMLLWTSRLTPGALRKYAGMPLDADNGRATTEGEDRDREEA
jgi:hypothetical protein